MTAHALALLARIAAALLMMGTLTGSLVVSCAGDPSSTTTRGGSNAPASQAMGQWTPASQDTCTKAFHDTFFVIGPDGKKYPTWHKPEDTDPATNTLCSFGHEHGSDPGGSNMWAALQKHFAFDANNNGTIDASELAASGIPFGYVSEQLVGSNTPRIEDHTAYKIAFSNGVTRTAVSGGNQFVSVSCDLFTAYNQPTSTDDAFASNMFSVTYGVDCNAGPSVAQYPVKAIASVMALYRNPGAFTIDANGNQLTVGQSPVPTTSPNSGGNELGRWIPTSDNVFPTAFVPAGGTSSLAALFDRWQARLQLRRADDTELATFSPAFQVADPARYYDVAAGALAHSVDLCYSGLNASGVLVTDPSTIVRQVRGVPKCTSIAPNGPGTAVASRIAFDDPRSPFLGCTRFALIGAEVVLNGGGTATTWYTTPFGTGGSTTRFTNSVRQLVEAASTNSIVLAEVRVGEQTTCTSSKVHVPN